MQPANAEYVDAAQLAAFKASPPRPENEQEAATEDVAALMGILVRAHEALTRAGVPTEGTLTARLAQLIDERDNLRGQRGG